MENSIILTLDATVCVGLTGSPGNEAGARDTFPGLIRPVGDIASLPGNEPGSLRLIAIPSRTPERHDTVRTPDILAMVLGSLEIRIGSNGYV